MTLGSTFLYALPSRYLPELHADARSRTIPPPRAEEKFVEKREAKWGRSVETKPG